MALAMIQFDKVLTSPSPAWATATEWATVTETATVPETATVTNREVTSLIVMMIGLQKTVARARSLMHAHTAVFVLSQRAADTTADFNQRLFESISSKISTLELPCLLRPFHPAMQLLTDVQRWLH